MQPTIDAELGAARRTLARLAEGDDVAPELATALADLSRSLRFVERSWETRLAHLLADNGRLVELLGSLPAAVVRPFEDEIAAATRPSDPGTAGAGGAQIEQSNVALRGVLARVIVAADEDSRATVRQLSRTALLRSIEDRPW